MQLAENRNLSNDVILRLSPSKNSIIVEEKRPGGIVCYREIDPMELYYVINGSYTSNDFLDTGFLPENCLNVSMNATERTFTIWNPELRADVIYDNTEYANFPLPRLVFSQLKMNKVEISLYDVVKSTGEAKEAFKFTYGGRRYDRLSLSEKIRAGMEVSELIKRLTGRNYPVFVDNMESVDDLSNVHPTGQIIMAKCVSGTALQVRPMNPIIRMEQRVA